MFLLSFSVQQTTYRISNHVYYWVRLRPDLDGVCVSVRELLCCFPVVLQVLACAVRWVSSELSRCFLGSVLQIGSQMFPLQEHIRRRPEDRNPMDL